MSSPVQEVSALVCQDSVSVCEESSCVCEELAVESSECIHCSKTDNAMRMILRYYSLTARLDLPMPDQLLRAFERHTGLNYITFHPTGKQPVRELCASCFIYIKRENDIFLRVMRESKPKPFGCHCCRMILYVTNLFEEFKSLRYDISLPVDLLLAFQSHTGINNLTKQPTGQTPTNELCLRCFDFMKRYVDRAYPTRS